MAQTYEQKKGARLLRARVKEAFEAGEDAPDVIELAKELYRVAGGREKVAAEIWKQYSEATGNSLFKMKVLNLMMSTFDKASPKDSDSSRLKKLSEEEINKEIDRFARLVAKQPVEEPPDPEFFI